MSQTYYCDHIKTKKQNEAIRSKIIHCCFLKVLLWFCSDVCGRWTVDG